MSFGPCQYGRDHGKRDATTLDVVSGGSTQIVVGPKWRGHRPDSTPIPVGQHSCPGLAVSRAPS
jgi:hypothetical protein